MSGSRRGGDLFIVDNSDPGWTGLRYLEEWCELAKSFDIATGYFATAWATGGVQPAKDANDPSRPACSCQTSSPSRSSGSMRRIPAHLSA